VEVLHVTVAVPPSYTPVPHPRVHGVPIVVLFVVVNEVPAPAWSVYLVETVIVTGEQEFWVPLTTVMVIMGIAPVVLIYWMLPWGIKVPAALATCTVCADARANGKKDNAININKLARRDELKSAESDNADGWRWEGIICLCLIADHSCRLGS
jgi:hypothetical protein